jgi:hypothetical protein
MLASCSVPSTIVRRDNSGIAGGHAVASAHLALKFDPRKKPSGDARRQKNSTRRELSRSVRLRLRFHYSVRTQQEPDVLGFTVVTGSRVTDTTGKLIADD